MHHEPLLGIASVLFITGVVLGLGLLVAAAGFAGVSRALIRMTNDEFDLPAVSP